MRPHFGIIVLLAILQATAVAADDASLSVFIPGRGAVEYRQLHDQTHGLIETAVFVGEPVNAKVTAVNVTERVDVWARRLEWSITTHDGKTSGAKPLFVGEGAAPNPAVRAGRANAQYADFEIRDLQPGRYVITVSLKDGRIGESMSSEPRSLAIYRGNENEVVRRVFLRDRAQQALARGTLDSYHDARSMLLEAAKGSTDPSLYELLADASAPWAGPDDTLRFYEQSLGIARMNLESRFGQNKSRWPVEAARLYSKRERKVAVFRELTPYYKANFQSVRVKVVPQGRNQQFVVERRSDGRRIRVVNID